MAIRIEVLAVSSGKGPRTMPPSARGRSIMLSVIYCLLGAIVRMDEQSSDSGVDRNT